MEHPERGLESNAGRGLRGERERERKRAAGCLEGAVANDADGSMYRTCVG